MYRGFIALGILCIKASAHFQAFLQVVPFAHRKEKKDNKEDAEEMTDFKHGNHVQLSFCSVS